MQMQAKVIRLDLQYNSQESRIFAKETRYIAPFKAEEAPHFAKRLLAYLSLFELHPTLALQDHAGKAPDLYLQDLQQHYQLWCQVDLPNEKQLQKAAHQADEVLMVCTDAELKKALALVKGYANVRLLQLTEQQLLEFSQMFKNHMQLSVWRESQQLSITDGSQQLELPTTTVSAQWH